jgi:hypothetical protein
MADPLPIPSETDFPDTSGISDDDRRDILAQIDRVAQENRIQTGPEAFVLHPRKRGLLVPVAVNVGALVIMAVGLFVFYSLYQQSAQGLVQTQVVLLSPEGKLIEEIKKQSQTELLAKDQQIADIQKHVESLNQQKNDLQTSMEQKIAEKEAQLRQALNDAVAAERARLTAAGYSQAIIEEKIREFEKKKNAEYNQALEDYKKKAEADRAALENNLKQQQNDYQKNLTDLAGERQRILDESRRRQSDLQSQLDQKNRDLESAQSANKAQLAAAQKQLNDLNDQRSKTDAVENQLLGQYTKIAQAIQSRQFADAQTQVQGLTAYLNDPTVKSLPGIQKRRDADLFLAASLSDWLTADQKRLDSDAARVQVTQGTLDTIDDLAKQAAAALASGKADQADQLYTKALNLVPSVLEAHEYFLEKAVNAEVARKKVVADNIAAGEAAFIAGDIAGAQKFYNLAVDALPLTPNQRAALAGHGAQATYQAVLQDQLNQADDTYKKDLANAQALLKAGQADQAVAAFVALLEKYPVGKAGFTSLAGIRQASIQLQQNASDREKVLMAQLDKVKSDLASNPGTGDSSGGGADPKALQDAQDEANKLRPDAVALQTMRTGFQSFVSQDNPLWTGKTPDSTEILQSKLLLNSFLSSPEVSTAFPGLATKVGRYDKSYLEAGQKESLTTVSDALSGLAQLTTATERKRYLATLQKRYAGNPGMSGVITSLGDLVK